MERIVAIRKPKGPTSHDIVNAVRRITGERRVGHAGTLDPMAEGVLVIGIGREATRALSSIVEKEKEYIATVRFGATSDTDDAEGTTSPTPSTSPSETEGENETTTSPSRMEGESGTLRIPPTIEDIVAVIPRFTGRIAQVPPVYSAVKIRGTPAHRRARRGETVHLAARTVTITAIDILRYAWPELELRVVCGPGTYIRALARDLGAALGVGGYLTALTRTRVGAYTIAGALSIDELARRWNAGISRERHR